MLNMPPTATTTDVLSLDAARQRRHYIGLANAHPVWQEIKASFAISGIQLTDDNAEQAGHMIAGDITYMHLASELAAKYKR